MSKSIRVFGVCLLLSGLLAAGCGDEEGAPAGGATTGAEASDGQGESADGAAGELEPTSESKAEYTAKANALCKKRKRQIQADLMRIFKEVQEEEGSQSQQQQQAGLRKLVEEAVAPGLEAEAEELRELGAPDGDEAQVEEVLAAIEALVAEMRETPQAFATNPAAFEKAQRPARKYGIGACGSVS